ncbi:MAG: cell division protein FtsL [Deltaproteobacteria bacterium]|nr:cell division protein FtsL [Deltaproteobacteria bacterium]
MSRHYESAIRTIGSYAWPETRIRRRGIAGYQNLKRRTLLRKSAAYLAVFFLFSLGYVWARVKVIETGYRLRRLEEVQEKLKEENRSLAVEAATLRSPQRLERLAAQVGLKRPTEKQIYFLDQPTMQ